MALLRRASILAVSHSADNLQTADNQCFHILIGQEVGNYELVAAQFDNRVGFQLSSASSLMRKRSPP